jgi:hypothetical protein
MTDALDGKRANRAACDDAHQRLDQVGCFGRLGDLEPPERGPDRLADIEAPLQPDHPDPDRPKQQAVGRRQPRRRYRPTG